MNRRPRLLFSKGGGSKSPTKTPDTLNSTDTVEVLLGISEGPIKGLRDGPKSFRADDTALVNENGEDNFTNFEMDFYPGDPTGHDITLSLGGFSNPSNYGVVLAQSTPVIRAGVMRGINAIDFRFVINQLMKSNDKGTFTNKLSIKIEIKKKTEATWKPAWFSVLGTPIPPTTNPNNPTSPGTGQPDTWTSYGRDRRIDTFEYDAEIIQMSAVPNESNAIPKASNSLAANDTTGTLYKRNTTNTAWVATPTTNLGSYEVTESGRRLFRGTTTPNPALVRIGDIWWKGLVFISQWNGTAWVFGGSFTPQAPQVLSNGIWSIDEKVSSPTPKDIRIYVDPIGDTEYEFRVTKLTPDSGTEEFSVVVWESVQEIDRSTRNIKGVAMVRVLGQASDQFTALPTWNGDYEGRIIKVPTNYNPETRVYTGVWDGTYKLAYTTNTAFIFQDFVENNNYGLSSVYPHTVNKWKIYEWAQYCDEMVLRPDGTLRPRWTYNDYIQEPREAKEMAQYIAGTASARYVDDGNGVVTVIIDKDDPAIALFTPENIGTDGFKYSYTDRLTRANEITVEFVNPNLNWQPDKRIVKDDADIEVYGRITENFIAVGCTDEDEALSRAYRRLIGGLTEKEIVNFETNRKGRFLSEMSVILLGDPSMGRGLTGRIKSVVDTTQVTLRDMVTLEPGITYWANFDVVNPDYPHASDEPFKVEKRRINSPAGTHTALSFSTGIRTNSIMVRNYSPENLIGVVPIGPGNAPVSIATDVEAVAEANLLHLLPDGKVYKLDNSAGTEWSGANIYMGANGRLPAGVQSTISAYIRGGAGSLRANGGAMATTFGASPSYVRQQATGTPVTGTEVLQIRAAAGQVVYFILYQLEPGAVATAPILVEDNVSRTVSILQDLPEKATFTIEAEGITGYPKPYRITNIENASGASDYISITAVELNRAKYALVDLGVSQDPADPTFTNTSRVSPPENVTVGVINRLVGAERMRVLSLNWDRSPSQWVNRYTIYHSLNGTLVGTYSSTDLSYEVENVSEGKHLFEIIAHNTFGRKSLPARKGVDVTGVVRYVAPPTGLAIEGGLFDTPSPTFLWALVNPTPGFSHYLVEVINPTTMLPVFSDTTGQTTSWTYDFNDNAANGLLRSFWVYVYAVDQEGNTSTPATMLATNAAPGAPLVTVTPAQGGINVTVSSNAERDLRGIKLIVSTTPGSTTVTHTLDQSSTFIPLADNATRYVKAAYYDTFGATGLNYSTEQSGARTPITPGDLDNTPPADVTGLTTPVVSTIVAPDGTVTKSMSMSWTAVASVTGYDIDVNDGTTSWTEWTPINSLKNYRLHPGRTYTFKVKAVTRTGVRSTNWSSTVTTGSVVGDTTAPAGLSAPVIVPMARRNVLTWVNPADADYSHLILYRNTSGTSPLTTGEAPYILKAEGSSFTDTNVLVGTTYYYWGRATDTSGNSAGFQYMGFGTPTYIRITGGGGFDIDPTDPNLVTNFGTSAFVNNQSAWVTATTLPLSRLDYLDNTGNLDSLSRVTNRNLSLLNGRTADNLTYVSGGATVESLRPGEAGANVTESRTAALIAGQSAWATATTIPTSRVNNLDASGNLTSLNNITNRNLSLLNGRTADNITYIGGGGVTLEVMRPQEAGANVTESRTAALIAGQSAWATATTIPTSRLNNLDASGNLTSLNNITTRNLSLLTGRTADNITYITGGVTVDSLRPGEAGANVTESRTAALIAGQSAWATATTIPTSRLNNLDASGNLTSLNNITTRTFSLLTGRTADNLTYVGSGNPTVNSLRPGEAGANVTEGRTAALVSGQGALATLNSVGSPQILPGAVLPSRLGVGDTSNAHPDPHLVEEGGLMVLASTLPNAATLPVSSTNAIKHASAGVSRYSAYFNVEAGEPIFLSWIVDFDPGETGRLGCQIYWYDSTKAQLSPTSSVVFTTPVGGSPGVYSGIVTAPAGAAFGRIRTAATGTVVSGVYNTNPVMRRAADFGGLIVRETGVVVTDADAITGLGTAALIAGQSAWATATTIPTSRLNNLDASGNLTSLNNITTRNLSLLTGRTADNITYITGGVTVDSLRPGEAGANVTESRTAALVSGQGSLATQNTVTALQVPYVNIANSFNDEDFNSTLIGAVNGAAYDTSAETTTTLGVIRSIKSPDGAGKGAGVQNQMTVFTNLNLAVGVTAGIPFRYTGKALVKAGFTGLLRAFLYFTGTTGATVGSPTVITIVDRRAVAQATTLTYDFDQQVTPPAGSVKCYFVFFVDWSSTQTNAGYALIAKPGLRFVTDFAGLHPNAVRFGSNVRMADGTTMVTDATAITSLGTAALIAGQSAWATATTIPTSRLNNLDASGNLTSLSNITTRNLSLLTGRTADNLTYVSGGATVESLRPQEAGANVTESRTAALIAGQSAWATATTIPTSRLDNLDASGNLTSLNNITSRNLSLLTGRTADNLTYVSGGATVESLRPQEAGANVTEGRTAALISGQSDWATATTIPLTRVQYLNNSGRIIDGRGMPLNVASGRGISFTPAYMFAAPGSNADTQINVLATTVTLVGGATLSLPSGSLTGLTAGTSYSIFRDIINNTYLAIDGDTTAYRTSADQYLYMGGQSTQISGGGGYVPPPPPPPGSGDMLVREDL